MLSSEGWTDCLPLLQAEAAKLKRWDVRFDSSVAGDEGLSSPEAMDPKTDSGFSDVVPLAELKKLRKVVDSAALSEADVVDAMDALFAFEAAYYEGTPLLGSLLSFIPFHEMQLLDGCPALKAYARSVLKGIHLTIAVIAAADVREGEEEFTTYTYELDPLFATPMLSIIDEVTAATDALGTSWPAVRDRLLLRRELAAAAHHATSLPGAASQLSEAVARAQRLLPTVRRPTTAAAAAAALPLPRNPTLFYDAAPLWLPISTPLPKPHVPHWDAAVTTWDALLRDVATALSWPTTAKTLPEVLQTVKVFGEAKPSLLARSIAMLFLFEERAGSLLGSLPIHEHLLRTLTTTFGAPVYEKVFKRDEAIVAAVCEHRARSMHRGMPLELLQASTVDAVCKWTMDLSRIVMGVLHAYLSNRGRCHQRLMLLVPSLGVMQAQSYELDALVFGRGHVVPPREADALRELVSKSGVLAAFVNELTLEVMEVLSGLVVELDLISKPELLALLFLRNNLCASRLENYSALVVQTDPATLKTAKKTLPPAAYMRTPAAPLPWLIARLEISRPLTNAAYMLVAATQGAGWSPNLRQLPNALQTTERMFNNRFAYFLNVRKPAFVPYADSTRQVDQFARNVPTSIAQAMEIYNVTLKRIDTVMADPTIPDKAFFLSAKKTCKANVIAAKLMEKEVADQAARLDGAPSRFAVDVGADFHPSLVTFKPKMLAA